jgi:Ca-activated chloride channel family protein
MAMKAMRVVMVVGAFALLGCNGGSDDLDEELASERSSKKANDRGDNDDTDDDSGDGRGKSNGDDDASSGDDDARSDDDSGGDDDSGSDDDTGYSAADDDTGGDDDYDSDDDNAAGDDDTGGDDDAFSDDDSAELPNTNIALGGSQDFGFFRAQLDDGTVPALGSFDAAGFFAEHHTQLPPPDCGNRVCLQAMLGVMSNLLNGNNCTMLQLGLNSPIAADASNRPPLTLAVVVDTSGSMADENKLDFVVEGLDLLIDGLGDEDQFALVTYESNAGVEVPMAGVGGNRVVIRRAIEALGASGSTNLYDGLELGYREVFANYDSARQNRVILLSDGNPTAGITGESEILRMSRNYNSEGVGLTAIGLGTDFNVELMRDLALQADGNYYFLENAGAVSEVFDEELSYFTVPVAFV